MVNPMGFKHTGVFPEQAVNWDMTAEIIRKERRPLRVLNLFAYTGAATISALNAGAHVTHVDASKGMVAWAKENAAVSGLANEPANPPIFSIVAFETARQAPVTAETFLVTIGDTNGDP